MRIRNRSVEIKWVLLGPILGIAMGIGLHLTGGAQTPTVIDWDAVARCRSGGVWNHKPIQMNQSGILYSGGLMLPLFSWEEYGGTVYKPLPHQATKAQQIAIAVRIASDPATGGEAFAAMLGTCEGDMTRQGAKEATLYTGTLED